MASIKWCHFVIFSPGFCRASRHWVNSVSSVALKPSRTCPIISSVRSRSWSYTEKVMAVHCMVSGCGEMQNMNLSPKTGSIHFFFIFVWWRSFSSPFKESSTRTYGSDCISSPNLDSIGQWMSVLERVTDGRTEVIELHI